MLDSALLLAFCLLVGLISLAVCGWVLITGQLLTLDGLLLTSISLTIGLTFMANVAWSARTGELREVLNYLRNRSSKNEGQANPPATPQK